MVASEGSASTDPKDLNYPVRLQVKRETKQPGCNSFVVCRKFILNPVIEDGWANGYTAPTTTTPPPPAVPLTPKQKLDMYICDN